MIFMDPTPSMTTIVKPDVILEKTLKKIDRFRKNKSYLIYVLKHYRNHSCIPSLENKETDELKRAVITLIDMGLLAKRIISSTEAAFDRRYNISITKLGTDILDHIDKNK